MEGIMQVGGKGKGKKQDRKRQEKFNAIQQLLAKHRLCSWGCDNE